MERGEPGDTRHVRAGVFIGDTDALTAHLRLGAVVIEDAHLVVLAVLARKREDDAVAADAEVPVAQLHRLERTNGVG